MPQWNVPSSPLVSLSSTLGLILSSHHNGGSQGKLPWLNSGRRENIFDSVFGNCINTP